MGRNAAKWNEYRAPKVVEKVERVVSEETKRNAWVTRWIKNHREVAGVGWVRKQPTKKALREVRKIAIAFYPAWVVNPWARFLFPRHEQVKPKAGCRIPLNAALDWEVDHPTMQAWKHDARTTFSSRAHPDLQFFVNPTGKKLITRTFAECLLAYSRNRWAGDTGDERAHDCIVEVLKHAARDGRRTEHRRQTDKRKRLAKKFTTRSRTEYWRWLLSILHGTDMYTRPKERFLAAVTVDYQDGLDHEEV
jgi:hypothetical protein